MATLRGPRLTPDNRPDQGRQPDQPTWTDMNSRQTALDGLERVAIALAAAGKQAPRPTKSVLPTGKPPAIRSDMLDEQESAAGPEHAPDFTDDRVGRGHGAEHQCADDGVKAGVGKRQRLRRCVDDLRRKMSGFIRRIESDTTPATGEFEHFSIKH